MSKTKGGVYMPGRDGTGPLGQGAMTGRGLGFCTVGKAVKYGAGLGLGLGLGFGCRRGIGRFFSNGQTISETRKEWLEEEKGLLESRIEMINTQLKNL
jgi:hypothetical protein